MDIDDIKVLNEGKILYVKLQEYSSPHIFIYTKLI